MSVIYDRNVADNFLAIWFFSPDEIFDKFLKH